ncbi:MAG: Flp pilus assembly protein CpaB [Gemmatales bacterium]
MQSKTPLLMVTALVCGLGAAFGTWKLVSGSKDNPIQDEKVQVLVPVAEVAPYHLFQDQQRFTTHEVYKSKLREELADTITSFDQVKGKTTRHYKLKPMEPIYKSDIVDNIEDDVNERLQNGEVAHAVQVTADNAGGGFIKVGNRVNIVATIQPTQAEPSITTKNILEDIEILAVDNQSKKEMTPMATPPTRFLVRLTHQQALVMKFFQDTSKISIDLRRSGDKTKLGDSFWMTMGKRINAVESYKDDVPEATTTVTLDTKVLADPTDDPALIIKSKPVTANKELTEAEITLLRNKLNPHDVIVNDSGTKRVIKTNETYNTKEEVKQKVPVKKEGEEEKKDTEKKESEEKKPAQQ